MFCRIPLDIIAGLPCLDNPKSIVYNEIDLQARLPAGEGTRMNLQKLNRFLVHNPLVGRYFERARIRYHCSLMTRARAKQGIAPKKVVFSSFRAGSYSDNPRAISEKLHEMYPAAEIVWLFNDPEAKRALVPDYVRVVNADVETSLPELGTARIWVDNFAKRYYLPLDKERQVYLNTWHGDRAFKKIGYDVKGPHEYRLEEDCHCMIAGSDFGARMMRSAFNFHGDLLVNGSPRNDRLVNYRQEEADAIRAKLGIDRETHLLLYAPTFRDTTAKEQAQPATMDLKRTLQALERRTGGRWLCLFRAHYLALKGLDLSEVRDRMLDMTKYEDMTDLLMIADALLTDYSSCAMDFCLLGRPIYLFQSDIEAYTTQDREMYFDMKDTPFFAARDQAELERLIETVDAEAARENCRQICDYFGFHETGHATEEVCKYLIAKLEGTKYEA